MRCEICSSPAAHWADIKGYPHFRCSACGHVFVSPRPSQDELARFYASAEYYQAAEDQRDRLVRDARGRLKRLARLSRRFSLPLRILDVGCASGIFLFEAIRKGWQAEGNERSEATAAQARALSGASVHRSVLEDGDVLTGPFPFVTAWEVIEHTADPGAFLAALVRQVQPGGLIALSTPLIDGLPAKIMGTRFPMLIPPEHLSLFSKRSLSLLARSHGLEAVSYRSFSNLDAASLASGLSRKLLRCELRDTPRLLQMLLRIAGLSLAWMPYLVDWLGYGSEMEVVYRRSST